jgi:hypothetical protein
LATFVVDAVVDGTPDVNPMRALYKKVLLDSAAGG